MPSRNALLGSLPALFQLASVASGEDISFYLGPQCTDAFEGSVDTSKNGECFQVPTNAQSAVLQIDNSNYAENVKFYGSSDCTGTVEAQGNTGCIDFEGLGANALSYKLNKQKKRSTKVRADASNFWDADAEYHRNLLGISAENATGSLAPHWDPYAMVDAGYGHGNVTEAYGQVYKWQQVALGVTIGIPVDEWDDEIHTASDEFILFGEEDYDSMLAKRWADLSDGDELMKRWNYGQCRAVLQCGRQLANSATVNIGNGWQQAVNAAYKAKTYGKTFYDWAHNHPFSVGIATTAGGTLAGYGLGKTGGGATAQDNDQLGSCASDTTQKQAFIQSLATVAGASSDNCAEVAITLDDGDILTISAAVYPKGHAPSKANSCGARS